MESTFTLLKVRGVAIGAHWSWLFVSALVVWSLASAVFPATYPGLDGSTHLVMAIVAAAVLFGSVVLHELGHAFRALDEGMPIKGITLWLFGGVAHLSGSPPSPGAEFRVAACGPVVSLVLAGAFGAAAWAGDRVGWPQAVQGTVDYLGRINLILFLFNLVPALPLDGGRVLRAWLWHRQQSFTAATRSAAAAGQAFGSMLVAIGLLGLLTGTGASGLWFTFLGWFLVLVARAEAVGALVRQALDGLRVGDLMEREPVPAAPGPVREGERTIDPDRPAIEALDALRESGGRAIVVDHGTPVGLLRAVDVAETVERQQGRSRPGERARGPGLLVWVVVGLVMLVAGAALYHPPYVVISPGEAIEVSDDIRLSGVPVDDLNGRYLISTVRLSQASALRTLWASLRSDREVVPISALLPPGVSSEEYVRAEREVFRESREIAAAAAAQAVGLPVDVTGSGARILEVAARGPAAGKLEEGDVIVAVDGREIDTAADLVDTIRSRPAVGEFELVVERGTRRTEVEVQTRELPDPAEGIGIGVVIDTRGLAVDLPFEVLFEERDIGGPSAGLAYALAIADLLDPGDYAQGRVIAATGTVGVFGDVGPVGGAEQKAVAVDEAGASLFLVPRREIGQADRGGVAVRGVDGLGEALAILQGAGRGPVPADG